MPPFHPFTNVQSANYWSAATDAANPTLAWDVLFGNDNVDGNIKAGIGHVWCVRGGMMPPLFSQVVRSLVARGIPVTVVRETEDCPWLAGVKPRGLLAYWRPGDSVGTWAMPTTG